MFEFYLYLSGNWVFSDSMWQVYSLNCFQFPNPPAFLCFNIFLFPNSLFLNHPSETHWRPGRLKQKAFTSNRGTGTYIWFQSPSPHFFNSPQSQREQVQEKQGSKVGGGEVNHKLSRGIQF